MNINQNVLITPGIYKHFKGKNYATMFPVQEINENIELEGPLFKGKCTETGELLEVFKDKEGDYVIPRNNEKLERYVAYKSLYDDTGVYLRPIDMFLEKVPKGKENPTKQTFRFEYVKL